MKAFVVNASPFTKSDDSALVTALRECCEVTLFGRVLRRGELTNTEISPYFYRLNGSMAEFEAASSATSRGRTRARHAALCKSCAPYLSRCRSFQSSAW